MKILVTHYSPDLDAISSCWLIKRYLPDWHAANIKFVPAGQTFENKPVDSVSNIIHVDTGLGRFDHHQSAVKTSATELVFNYLVQKKFIPKKEIPPLQRMVEIITLVDNFGEVFLPNPTADIYDFNLYQIIEGLKNLTQNDNKLCELVFLILDATLVNFKNKLQAESEIKKGFIFQSKWGKSLAMENGVEESVKLAQKKGYDLVIRKQLKNGMIRIKARPDTKYGLKDVYQKIKEIDSKATWYLHPSQRILLNGSLKNPKTKPSTLSLKKIIEIIKSF